MSGKGIAPLLCCSLISSTPCVLSRVLLITLWNPSVLIFGKTGRGNDCVLNRQEEAQQRQRIKKIRKEKKRGIID